MLKIIKIIGYVFLSLFVLFSIYFSTLFIDKILFSNEHFTLPHFRVFVVMSGSMEAGIKVGDLVVTKNVSEEKIKVGDVISFYDDTRLVVTHRIVRIENYLNKKKYITKGDYNNTEDIYDTFYNDIIGVVVFKIPKMGRLLLFLRRNIIVFIASVLTIILFLFNMSNNKNESV